MKKSLRHGKSQWGSPAIEGKQKNQLSLWHYFEEQLSLQGSQVLSKSLPTPASRLYLNHFPFWLNLWIPAGRRVAPAGSGLFLQVIYVTIFHAFNKTQLKINRSSMAIWEVIVSFPDSMAIGKKHTQNLN